jgi:hypothetical protein
MRVSDTIDNMIDQAASSSNTYPVVLATEDADQFASLQKELEQEIKPTGVIERMYVADIAALLWEILRLRRFKTAILNNAFRKALQDILRQCLFRGEFITIADDELEADTLAHDWFKNQKAKDKVTKLLRQHQLDEDAIPAEAFRQVSSEIETLDRLLTLAERRRDRALRNIAEYRFSFAKRLQQSSERILENSGVLALNSP